MSAEKTQIPLYKVKCDTREQKPWNFPVGPNCLGTVKATLKTGDYTLEGYEDLFVIERKRNTGEIAGNIFQDRFERELERLDSFKHAYLVCEFTLADIIKFPLKSGIPTSKWDLLRVTPQLLLRKLQEIQVRHALHLIFAGPNALEFCSSLFKRITENVLRTN